MSGYGRWHHIIVGAMQSAYLIDKFNRSFIILLSETDAGQFNGINNDSELFYKLSTAHAHTDTGCCI